MYMCYITIGVVQVYTSQIFSIVQSMKRPRRILAMGGLTGASTITCEICYSFAYSTHEHHPSIKILDQAQEKSRLGQRFSIDSLKRSVKILNFFFSSNMVWRNELGWHPLCQETSIKKWIESWSRLNHFILFSKH